MFKWSKIALMVMSVLAVASPAMAQEVAAAGSGTNILTGQYDRCRFDHVRRWLWY